MKINKMQSDEFEVSLKANEFEAVLPNSKLHKSRKSGLNSQKFP